MKSEVFFLLHRL